MSITEIILLVCSVLMAIAYFVREYQYQEALEQLRKASLMEGLYKALFEGGVQCREASEAITRFKNEFFSCSLGGREPKNKDGKER